MTIRKKQRPLKEYEIDVDVIDLDAYVAYHTRDHFPLIFEYEDEDVGIENSIILFYPDDPLDDFWFIGDDDE